MIRRINTTDAANKRMLSWNEAAQYTGLGKNTVRKYADSIGAVRKIGKRTLFDRTVIDADLDRKEGADDAS